MNWNTNFDWYFEAFQCYMKPKIAPLQTMILRLTKTSK